MSTRDTIVTVVTDVAREQRKTLAPLDDDAMLLDLGLDSLCIAVIVARLEAIFGRDPFSVFDDVEMPATFGGLVKLYDAVLV